MKKIKYSPMLGTVKDLFTSPYHGVRMDKRKEVTYWRASIMLNHKKAYLGAYLIEEEAGYAFNVAYNIFANGKTSIVNNVSLSNIQHKDIEAKVLSILLKAGHIDLA